MSSLARAGPRACGVRVRALAGGWAWRVCACVRSWVGVPLRVGVHLRRRTRGVHAGARHVRVCVRVLYRARGIPDFRVSFLLFWVTLSTC